MRFPGFGPQSQAGAPVIVFMAMTSDMLTPTYLQALSLRSVSGDDPHSSIPDIQGTWPPSIRLDFQDSQMSHFSNFCGHVFLSLTSGPAWVGDLLNAG